jgi:membrane protease YdiL (CAAX protease family)
MLLVWKNKGILVLLYIIVCFIGTAILVGVLHRNYGGIFSKIDFYTGLGFACLFTSIWTYLTKDDYYKDKEGNRKKMDTVNEFFWINMRIWAIIFLIASFIFFGNLLFNYFEPLTS